ncbi:MAG: cation-transporting P-type ATPase, partial [Candidatus Woesearchaeota archaeon]|nr:cation-transporting P-type ATPase [Candidatus Woesearchaeota archaeon]
MNEHKVSLEYFYKIVRSSALGLSDEKASLRLAQYGKNILVQKKRYQLIFKFLRQFTNFFAILLILGGLLAFLAEYLSPGMGNLYIGIALLVVVVLNALFTFIQEYQSEQILESFKKMLPQQVTVIRNGEEKQLEAAELTVGDVFLLQEGDKVPADGRLIEEHQLKIDLSSITGESEPELRKLECTHEHILESRNMVFSGTTVQSGNGKAVVYATGMHTEIGRIISLTRQSEKEANPLHKEISRFIRIISIIAIVLGSVFFALSILLGQLLIGSIIFAIGIIVANVPEGLLPTVTLCLTIASKRMAKKNALIKNLESVETLGSTTVICTDKTGTLTQNKMSLASLFVDGMFINVDRPLCKSQAFQKLILNMSLCNNSKYTSRGLSGDPTETALLAYAQKFLGKKNISSYPRIHEAPFDSKTKRMISTCIVEGRKIAFMKGAPEVILEKCSRILVGSSTRMLTADEKNKLTQTYCSLASRGERVLGFGYKQTSTAKVKEDHFIFLGLVGLTDPPRKEVKEAIRKATSAGIRVIMITGDHTLTAESIAQKIGLINGKPNMVTGDQLKNMPQKRFRSILQKENLIFARTNPFQKLQIVRALKELGEIVTVTGDGVNDAPALKHADM